MIGFDIIAAIDSQRGLGKSGDLAWRLPEEMKYFQELTSKTTDPTKQNAVVMGRTTWESIPDKHRPLKGRLNVVLTRNSSYSLPEGVYNASSIKVALEMLSERIDLEKIYVIGGAKIYEAALLHNLTRQYCKNLYLTEIQQDFNCDVFFPQLTEEFEEIKRSCLIEEKGINYQFVVYENRS